VPGQPYLAIGGLSLEVPVNYRIPPDSYRLRLDPLSSPPRWEFRLQAGVKVFRRSRLRATQTQDFQGHPDCLTRVNAELQTPDTAEAVVRAEFSAFGPPAWYGLQARQYSTTTPG